MAISFHFRVPGISEILTLISFISLLIGSLLLKKENKHKATYLFLMGSSFEVLWQVINFFIPGIILPMIPSPEDIEFVGTYALIFTGIIPGTVLILSVGILPLLFALKNKKSDYIHSLEIGAIILIISVLIGMILGNSLLNIISMILLAISMFYFSLYGYYLKNWALIIFSVLFFISRGLYLLNF